LREIKTRAILASQVQYKGAAMKTASIPPLRVDPALRVAVENVLQEGESLSSFVEKSIRAQIDQRQTRQEFIARGLTARIEARQTGVYYEAGEVLDELDSLLRQAESATQGGR